MTPHQVHDGVRGVRAVGDIVQWVAEVSGRGGPWVVAVSSNQHPLLGWPPNQPKPAQLNTAPFLRSALCSYGAP